MLLKTQNNLHCLKFYYTHTYINNIYFNYCIERIYRKEKLQVSSHQKTNSRLINFKKYIDTNSITLYKIYNY